jgi:hypothetical protein
MSQPHQRADSGRLVRRIDLLPQATALSKVGQRAGGVALSEIDGTPS